MQALLSSGGLAPPVHMWDSMNPFLARHYRNNGMSYDNIARLECHYSSCLVCLSIMAAVRSNLHTYEQTLRKSGISAYVHPDSFVTRYPTPSREILIETPVANTVFFLPLFNHMVSGYSVYSSCFRASGFGTRHSQLCFLSTKHKHLDTESGITKKTPAPQANVWRL